MICGIDARSPFTRLLITCGSAATRTGIALMIPCASPVISCNAASISIGILSISVCTNCVIIETIVGTSVGKACAIPVASVPIICKANSRKVGSIVPSCSTMNVTSPSKPSENCCAAPSAPSSAPVSPVPISSTNGVICCRRSAASCFSFVTIGSAIAPSAAIALLRFAVAFCASIISPFTSL